MTHEDRSYYRRRAAEEQANAAKAVSFEAKRAHKAMAERYRLQADGDSEIHAIRERASRRPMLSIRSPMVRT